jgi:AcrR family transcriptional regulator
MRLSRELVAESQRERLTGAMLALVDAQGFAGTSLADLIAQAHVPRDAFYRHFGSMEVCFQSAYNSHFAWGAGQVVSAFNAPELEEDERARAALAALSEFAREWPAAARVCAVDVLTVGHGALEARAQELAGVRALLDAALGAEGPHVERTPLLASAVLGGVRWAAYTHLRKRPRRELPRLGEELYGWIHAYGEAPFADEDAALDGGGPGAPAVGGNGGTIVEATGATDGVAPKHGAGDVEGPGVLDFPGDEPRERILRAVVSLAAGSDGEDCTYPKIAAAAGVSHDTFYKHFSSRQEAQLAACEGIHERLIRAARRASATAADWPGGVREGLDAYLAEAARDPQATRVMVLDSLSLGEPGRKFLERRARALKQLLRPALAAALGLPDAGAEMLVGAILEVLHEHALERQLEQLPALAEELAGIVLTPLLAVRHGVAPVGTPAGDLAARRHVPNRV